jgi:hypothetical protein
MLHMPQHKARTPEPFGGLLETWPCNVSTPIGLGSHVYTSSTLYPTPYLTIASEHPRMACYLTNQEIA